MNETLHMIRCVLHDTQLHVSMRTHFHKRIDYNDDESNEPDSCGLSCKRPFVNVLKIKNPFANIGD